MLVLRTPGGERPIAVVATDLDRTLTDADLNVVPEALAALAAVRAHGVRTVLATGRTERELAGRAELWATFDGFVLEGGALVGWGRSLRVAPEGQARIDRLEAWLVERGIAVTRGGAFLSVAMPHVLDLQEYPEVDGLSVNPNRDRVDVTARAVNKGAGLRLLLEEAGLTGVLAFGDAENDRSLFAEADYGVAVANAEADLKAKADEVTTLPGGRGVAAFLRTRLLPPVLPTATAPGAAPKEAASREVTR